jgi:hypothetical protein
MSRSRFPTLLSTADAMEWAANALEQLLGTMDLLVVLGEKGVLENIQASKNMSAEDRERTQRLREEVAAVVDPDVQRAAMQSGADQIRRAAVALKLASARQERESRESGLDSIVAGPAPYDARAAGHIKVRTDTPSY